MKNLPDTIDTIITQRNPSKMDIRNNIARFEAIVRELNKDSTEEPLEYPLEHRFTDGLYTRKFTIPEGHIIIGKIHKRPHIIAISTGEVTIISEDTGRIRLKAPCTLVCAAGSKRVIYAHETTEWMNIHATDKNTVEEVEEDLIAENYTELGLEEPSQEVPKWLL